MTEGSAVDVRLSQENLFYPLPLTNASIENIIKIENTLPADPEHPEKNIISFKVLSAVRYRYSVRPAIGFIAPGQHITIRFILDPEAIRRCKDPKDRVLPTKETKDSIYVDLAVVSNSPYGAACVKGFLEKDGSEEGASQFWKQHGPVQGATASPLDTRRRLRCVYDTKDQVPESLVMQLKQEAKKKASSTSPPPLSAPAVPSSRPSASPALPGGTGPPSAPPRRTSVLSPNSTTPRMLSPSEQSPNRPQGQSYPTPPRRESKATPEKAVTTGGKPPLSAKAVLGYKVPYAVCGVLLLLTLLCALYDSQNFVIWLFGK